jgi:O-antigen/teichoic acid export membrane protein
MTAEPEAVVEFTVSRFGSNRLFRDAGSMASSSMAAAVLGAAFWALAAKVFPAHELGVMTAVLAVVVAISTVIASATGGAYTALLPAVGAARTSVYARGQRLHLILAVVGGIAGALATTTFLSQVRASVGVGVLVLVGVLAWSSFSLQNSTLVALGRARWLPAVNVVMSLGKILLLAILAFSLSGQIVEIAFIVPAAAAVLILRPAIVRIVKSGKDLPATASVPAAQAVSEFNGLSLQMGAFSALSLGATTFTPFLVTMFAGPTEGALFALILTIVQTLDAVGTAMAASLVVHAASAPEHGRTMAGSILMRALVILTVGALALTATVPLALRFINPQYGEMGATRVIAMLSLGSVIYVCYTVWAGLQMSRRRMKWPLLINFVGALGLFACMPLLSSAHGAVGGAIAILVYEVIAASGAAACFLVNRRAAGGKHRTAARS